MRHSLRASIYVLPLISLVALFIITNTTTPLTAGPGGILVVFICLYIFWLSIFFIVLHFGVGIASRYISARRKSITTRTLNVGIRKAYYIASVLAFAPVLFLAMQSVGQLHWTDVALVSALLALAIFYIVKRS